MARVKTFLQHANIEKRCVKASAGCKSSSAGKQGEQESRCGGTELNRNSLHTKKITSKVTRPIGMYPMIITSGIKKGGGRKGRGERLRFSEEGSTKGKKGSASTPPLPGKIQAENGK